MRPILCSFLLLVACSDQPRNRPSTEAAEAEIANGSVKETQGQAAYGPVREMQGLHFLGRELSDISLCQSNDVMTCVEHSQPICWLQYSDEFGRQLQALVGDDLEQFGALLIRFRGRRANNGPFGHMSAYDCQIEGLSVISVAPGYP